MSEPKKIISQTLKQFPGGTWNALVEGELRDRVPQNQFQQPAPFAPPSTVLVQLIWMGSTSVPPGSVVVLTDPPREYSDDPSVPFGGLQFKCIAPTTATLDSPFAITTTPLAVLTGKKAMGWGYIPNSCWAQVTINDADDDSAELLDADTLLSSTTGGRVPIIWKPTGTGVKWCVVQLSASGSGGSVNVGLAFLTSDVTAATLGTNHVTLGEGSAKEFQQDDPDDPASWEAVGDAFTIYSKNPVLIRSGRVVTYQMHGNLEPIRIINDKDCG